MVTGATKMAVVGTTLLGSMGCVDTAVHIKHDCGSRFAGHTPGQSMCPAHQQALQRWRRRSTNRSRNGASGWWRRLADPFRYDPPQHRRIVGELVAVVDILITSQARKHGLAKQTGKQVARVLATSALRQRSRRQVRQTKRVIDLTIGQQSGIGCDASAVKLQLQAVVKIDPERPISRFTRWVLHPRNSNYIITY